MHLCQQTTKFRPSFARLHELRALVPSGIPMIVLTATVTPQILANVITQLDMEGCECVSVSPNRPNIFYSVSNHTDIDRFFFACQRFRN